MTRRDFLTKSGACAAAAGLLRARAGAAPGNLRAGEADISKGVRALGRTGISLPVLSMGVMNTFIEDLVKRSYELGVRHFDTAAYYQRGNNEIMVGKALAELGVRDQVIIGTKVYVPHEVRPKVSPEELKKIFLATAEESLKRLRTDYLDILYVHNVPDVAYLRNPGILEALAELRIRKKVRFLGFSTHTNMAACIEDATKLNFYDVVLTAFNYAMADDAAYLDTLMRAAGSGIGLIAMKTQCTQYWYREHVPQDKLRFYERGVLHSAVLKWAIRHDFITTAVPGYTTFDQLETDVAAAGNLEYTAEERAFLEDRGVKLALETYCVQCARCVPSCPSAADIPALMRAHLYAACYGNFSELDVTLRDIRPERGLEACRSCPECRAVCARHVGIRSRIEDLKVLRG